MAWQSRFLNHRLELPQISQFIDQFDGAFGGKLSREYHFSRVVSLAHFHSLVLKLGIAEQRHTGVIAGIPEEYELHFLKSEKVTFLNWERDPQFDLDKSWSALPSQNFSMTLCNQVLEHVFD